MRLEAPGWPWLLAHEMRLAWRASKASAISLAVVVGIFWVILHAAAWLLMRHPQSLLEAPAIYMAGGVTWFVLLFALALAFGLGIVALFERGDLDLLLSSPIRPRTVFAVRGIGVAVQSVAFAALFWLPFAHGAVLYGRWRVLATYPVIAAFGLGVTAIAFALTIALVRALGVRRAKIAAQVLGALAGSVMFLVSQASTLLPHEYEVQLGAWIRSDVAQSWLGSQSFLWWPARAVLGEPVPALAAIVLGCALFAAVMVLCERAFLDGASEPAVAPSSGRGRAASVRFQGGLARVVIEKELRLLARDPKLIIQTLMQVLYLVPLVFVMSREGARIDVLGSAVIVLAGTLAGNLGWMTMSGEESPDLLGSAPASRTRILWLKVAAAMAPSLAICAPFLAIYAMHSIASLAAFAFTLTGALASSAAVQAWNARPGSQRDLRVRAQSGKLVNMLEMLGNFGWAGACFGLMAGSPWFLAGVAVGGTGPAASWFVRRARDAAA